MKLVTLPPVKVTGRRGMDCALHAVFGPPMLRKMHGTSLRGSPALGPLAPGEPPSPTSPRTIPDPHPKPRPTGGVPLVPLRSACVCTTCLCSQRPIPLIMPGRPGLVALPPSCTTSPPGRHLAGPHCHGFSLCSGLRPHPRLAAGGDTPCQPPLVVLAPPPAPPPPAGSSTACTLPAKRASLSCYCHHCTRSTVRVRPSVCCPRPSTSHAQLWRSRPPCPPFHCGP